MKDEHEARILAALERIAEALERAFPPEPVEAAGSDGGGNGNGPPGGGG